MWKKWVAGAVVLSAFGCSGWLEQVSLAVNHKQKFVVCGLELDALPDGPEKKAAVLLAQRGFTGAGALKEPSVVGFVSRCTAVVEDGSLSQDELDELTQLAVEFPASTSEASEYNERVASGEANYIWEHGQKVEHTWKISSE